MVAKRYVGPKKSWDQLHKAARNPPTQKEFRPENNPTSKKFLGSWSGSEVGRKDGSTTVTRYPNARRTGRA